MTTVEMMEFVRTLPEGYQEFIDAAIPPLPASPANEEAANIACGRLAQFLLDFFGEMEGLHALLVPLYMGALHKGIQGLLLSSLEQSGDTGAIHMISPVDGGLYFGAVTSVSCSVDGATEVTVTTDGDSFSLENSGGNIWEGDWAFAIGEHPLTVAATFPNGDVSVSISFQVVNWDTVPQEGDTLTPGPSFFELNPGDTSVTEVTVSDGLVTWPLAYNAITLMFEGTKELAAGAFTLVFEVSVEGAGKIIKSLDIIVG